MDDEHSKPLRTLLEVMMDIQYVIFTHYQKIVDSGHVLNLVMMDIQYVNFYSLLGGSTF